MTLDKALSNLKPKEREIVFKAPDENGKMDFYIISLHHSFKHGLHAYILGIDKILLSEYTRYGSPKIGSKRFLKIQRNRLSTIWYSHLAGTNYKTAKVNNSVGDIHI